MPDGANEKLKVVLVEDEDLFRDLLRISLTRSGRIEVVGVYRNGETAVSESMALGPQIALLDIQLGSGLNGIQVGRLLRRQMPDLGIVLLSNHRHPSLLASVPTTEVAGWAYLLKQSVGDLDSLVRAIEAVAAGLTVLDPQLVARSQPSPRGRLRFLPPRRQEILSLIAQGFSNGAIAERMRIARKTVENQINILYEELAIDFRDGSVQPRVQAVLAYLRECHFR